jgi:polar amino acid transport system substrate-binding protein
MHKPPSILVFSLLFIMVIFHQSQAEVPKKVNVMACSLPLPPQTMPSENGKPSGLAVEVLNAVSPKLNWNVNISYYPWLRVVQLAKEGKCDITMTVLKRKDYAEFMIFPEASIMDQNNMLITLKKQNATYDGNLETFLKSHSVALYADKAINDDFEKVRRQGWAKKQITSVTYPDQHLKMLLSGRVEAVIENWSTAVYKLRKLSKLDQVMFHQPPLNTTPAYITFPKRGRLTSKEIESFNAALSQFKRTEEYSFIRTKYLGL